MQMMNTEMQSVTVSLINATRQSTTACARTTMHQRQQCAYDRYVNIYLTTVHTVESLFLRVIWYHQNKVSYLLPVGCRSICTCSAHSEAVICTGQTVLLLVHVFHADPSLLYQFWLLLAHLLPMHFITYPSDNMYHTHTSPYQLFYYQYVLVSRNLPPCQLPVVTSVKKVASRDQVHKAQLNRTIAGRAA